MKKTLFTLMSASLLLTGCGGETMPTVVMPEIDTTNPLLAEWNTPHQTPPFDQIKLEHYMPAFETAIAVSRAEVDAIVNNPAKPTFANTILALEQQGLYSVLLLIALEKMSELVLSDFADECRRHPENGRACDGVGCRTACHVMQAVRFQALENLVPGLHIHELHAALRQMVELEE